VEWTCADKLVNNYVEENKRRKRVQILMENLTMEEKL
jgi:hypothetical protein